MWKNTDVLFSCVRYIYKRDEFLEQKYKYLLDGKTLEKVNDLLFEHIQLKSNLEKYKFLCLKITSVIEEKNGSKEIFL